MSVKLLLCVIYDKDGWSWHTEEKAYPEWSAVERAIRRLEQFSYPYVWLYSFVPDENDMYNVNITGGNGIYCIDGFIDNQGFRFVNPDGGHQTIEVWTSDQGFETEEKYICRDVEVVLSAAKYYFEHGMLDPNLTWEVTDKHK
jgi:hypothetical protein